MVCKRLTTHNKNLFGNGIASEDNNGDINYMFTNN
jgi:hypothetical protein